MHRQNVKRTVTAAVCSLLVASLLFVGTVPVSSQSRSNSQGIPQQIVDLEQQVKTLTERMAILAGQNLTLSQRLFALDERLAGSTLGAGGGRLLRVVDATGAEVGPMISVSQVARKIGGTWVVFFVAAGGFAEFPVTFFNDQSNCQGKLYMQDFPDLLKQAYVINRTAYYSKGNPQNVAIAAYDTRPVTDTSCIGIDGTPQQSVSEVATSDLSTFVPPFTIRYDQ